MSISKEIFGIKRKSHPLSCQVHGGYACTCGASHFNEPLYLIDQFELSEEELAKVIQQAKQEWDRFDNPKLHLCPLYIYAAKAIKQNQSKIFVRKT